MLEERPDGIIDISFDARVLLIIQERTKGETVEIDGETLVQERNGIARFSLPPPQMTPQEYLDSIDISREMKLLESWEKKGSDTNELV